MKGFAFQLIIYIGILCAGLSCLSSKKTQANEAPDDSLTQENMIVPDTFVLPNMPQNLASADDRAAYLVMHYWDRFDFADTTLILRPQITEQAFVDYINILSYVPYEKGEQSLDYTLEKARKSTPMYLHFASLFEKYFYDANSPFRNEAFYIPVLRKLINSDIISDVVKSKYRFQWDMSMKNRVGQIANDFVYTLSTENSNTLHNIKSEYLILLFSNPGCATCAHVTEQLNISEALQKAFSMNSSTRTMLTVLTVYPDNNPNEWRDNLSKMPAKWVNAYDKDMQITKEQLYDIKAIPTIYLLDKDKKVILKDTSIEAITAFFAKPI